MWEGGRKVAWVPLERPGEPLLEVIGVLEEARRWRPGTQAQNINKYFASQKVCRSDAFKAF